MCNPLVWLDDILLGTAQKFCDKFQRQTGLTKFTLEKWGMILSAVLMIGGSVCTGSPLLIMAALVNAVITVLTVPLIEKAEATFFAGKAPLFGPCNTRIFRVSTYIAAAFGGYILSPIKDPADWLYLSTIAAVPVYVYFGACVPRPPSKSKMRELWERGLTWLNDQLKPAPALVPIPVSDR